MGCLEIHGNDGAGPPARPAWEAQPSPVIREAQAFSSILDMKNRVFSSIMTSNLGGGLMSSAAIPASQLKSELKRIYQQYRTSLLNRCYFAERLHGYRSWNQCVEIAIAIGTSATIGAWAIFKESPAKYVWMVTVCVSTILSVLKPIINLSASIERYSKLWTGHSEIYFDLEALVQEIQIQKALTVEQHTRFENTFEKYKKLSIADDDLRPNRKAQARIEGEVMNKIPKGSLWLP